MKYGKGLNKRVTDVGGTIAGRVISILITRIDVCIMELSKAKHFLKKIKENKKT